MNTAQVVVACVGAVTLLGMLAWIGVVLYLAWTKADEYASYFQNSLFIKLKVTSRRDSLSLQLWYIGSIASCVTFPRRLIERGELSAEDLNNLPPKMKRTFLLIHWASLGLFTTLMLTYVIGRFGFDL